MKSLIRIALALFVITALGCGSAFGDSSPWSVEECPGGCEEETQDPLLEGTYVSGHLGNYTSCSEGGYVPEGEPARSGDSAGACAPGSDCDSFPTCEDGLMTVRLQNTGDADARAVQVTRLELFDSEGVSRAELPLIEVIDASTNETFDGRLAAGESVDVRVVFLGPDNPYDMLRTDDESDGDVAPGARAGSAGVLEVTFTAENHDKLRVESGELYPVPSIDT